MALMNRPMTDDEAENFLRSCLTQYYPAPSFSSFFEPVPQYVRYDANKDRIVYERADTLYLSDPSPSDCRWIVPE